MVNISHFAFFNIGVNYEQSKIMSICSEAIHIFKILLSITNEYENPNFYAKTQKNNKIMANFQIFKK